MSERRISVFIQGRPDGGLRIYSPDVPGLILSHSNAELAGADIGPALRELRPDLFEPSVVSKCAHVDYDFAKHGRYCHCGEMMVDWGD